MLPLYRYLSLSLAILLTLLASLTACSDASNNQSQQNNNITITEEVKRPLDKAQGVENTLKQQAEKQEKETQ
ncbi:hypothetical protein BegalDRAFT_2416 [Beggiatoa alba B18LD]|uniref:Secreted protein n=1 Tax=Beggiatoa alba B18LD TaxID=395493 RepID=I3CI24_9GAMM|nr:hypothetical protein [Beggiatoa alba]EIJ43267.1 hypothetical protein BegalDRAFT_2416 [Beggiatoa alba B18LD]